MSIYETKLQYFPSKVWETKSLGSVTLKQFVLSHKNPKPEILDTFHKIEKASEEGDEKKKSYLKQNKLFYFVPSVVLDEQGRSYDNISYFNPIMVVEFDKIDHAEELKTYLFNNLKSCICAYMSPSKNGCKFLIRIPPVSSVEEYKEYFCGMAYYLEDYVGFDPANYNCVLPLFISYDEDILYRANPSEWNVRGRKVNEFNVNSDFVPEQPPTEDDKKDVVDKVSYLINRIEDSGHPQVVSTACLLGGWISAGYIGEEEGEKLIFSLISNNDYLKKNVSGYCKTARHMIKKGMGSPLPLND